jgi:hypothetical protein
MRCTMAERKAVTKVFSARYRRASKKEKGQVLDAFVEEMGWTRVYAARVLREHGRRVEVSPGVVLEGSVHVTRGRVRSCEYGNEVVSALRRVWRMMDYVCGKRLAAALPEVVARLVAHGELKVGRAVRDKLTRISASTIDRLLAPDRQKHMLRGRGRTKPGTLLKHQIPVRTFSEWNGVQPGFLEMDLVAHDGGCSQGEYGQTLVATDVSTGWTEFLAVPTKAQCWVFDAIGEMRQRLPFAVLGLDSDNGGEFINEQLVRYCVAERITFTRSRAGRKNDNCYVEQKNWSIVRRFVGYGRFDTAEACQCLNDLYSVLRDYVNFFLPSMKLKEKVRHGARVTKRYDRPQTPYQRVLASPPVSSTVKRRLRQRYAALNPAALKRDIEALQDRLSRLTRRIREVPSGPPKPAANHPWRRSITKRQAG